MKLQTFVVAIALTVAGCVSQSQRPDEIPNRNVLILSPQGIEQKADQVGFNALVERVTQSFSSTLSKSLGTAQYTPINVLDQSTKYNTGEKLAIYSVKNRAKKAIVITLESDNVGSDSRLSLRAQFIDQEFSYEGERLRGVKPLTVRERSYLLRSSLTGDNPKTMTDLVEDYVAYLRSEKLL
jgi:hypothetical protein